MNPLTQAELKNLRRIGHELKPVVLMGANGLTESLIEEVVRALSDHELIKVKLMGDGKAERKGICEQITKTTGATLVQQVGKIALLYKKNVKANPKLSNIARHGV